MDHSGFDTALYKIPSIKPKHRDTIQSSQLEIKLNTEQQTSILVYYAKKKLLPLKNHHIKTWMIFIPTNVQISVTQPKIQIWIQADMIPPKICCSFGNRFQWYWSAYLTKIWFLKWSFSSKKSINGWTKLGRGYNIQKNNFIDLHIQKACWLDWELCPIGFRIWIFGSLLEALIGEFMGPLGHAALPEDVCHWGQAVSIYSRLLLCVFPPCSLACVRTNWSVSCSCYHGAPSSPLQTPHSGTLSPNKPFRGLRANHTNSQ